LVPRQGPDRHVHLPAVPEDLPVVVLTDVARLRRAYLVTLPGPPVSGDEVVEDHRRQSRLPPCAIDVLPERPGLGHVLVSGPDQRSRIGAATETSPSRRQSDSSEPRFPVIWQIAAQHGQQSVSRGRWPFLPPDRCPGWDFSAQKWFLGAELSPAGHGSAPRKQKCTEKTAPPPVATRSARPAPLRPPAAATRPASPRPIHR
jgi:hypothetical protein